MFKGTQYPEFRRTHTGDIKETKFFKWTDRHMYRTSYHDMSLKKPVEKKNGAIPNYQGYVPGVNMIGKRYTELARTTFHKDKFEGMPSMYSSTGFNAQLIPKQDHTLHAICHKYGGQTIPLTHPHIRSTSMSTTARDSYVFPDNHPKPNLREIGKINMIDFRSPIIERPKTQNTSGFVQNSTLADGPGHLPLKVCHGDQFRTEYRNRFNTAKPFHTTEIPKNLGKPKMKKLVYDIVH